MKGTNIAYCHWHLVKPVWCCRVPGIVYRAIVTHLIKKAGYADTTACSGAVTP